MIATGSKEASEAALEILKLGGNAFDASIAAVMTSMTSEVNLTSMAGGGAMLAYQNGKVPILYDFFVDAPPMRNRDDFEFYKTKIDFGDGELIPKEVGSDDITGYRIKGMWYFDKRRGELMYRLLGLMPGGEDLKNIDGDEEKKTNLFWIWYPSIREILHNELVFNDTSNANRISFDQLLLSRRFSSYIYKEDNLYGDRAISAYKNKGLESILESARIKKEILDFEQEGGSPE